MVAGAGEQHPGCEVKFSGVEGPQTPVCLGGSAIRGCNDPEVCFPLLNRPGPVSYAGREPSQSKDAKPLIVPTISDLLSPGLWG